MLKQNWINFDSTSPLNQIQHLFNLKNRCQINAELTFLQAYHEAKSMQIYNVFIYPTIAVQPA